MFVRPPSDNPSHPIEPESSPTGADITPHAAAEVEVGEQPGETLGPYRLLERLGEGGFGIVWLAEQTAPLRRRVALKIIKPGMDSKAVIARFEQERQALALMSHPGIARVFDAGTTALSPAGGGRPYFVMEHVKGLPITDYCDRHKLTVEERLRLFARVCEAVQHAHTKGILHRDLKPSNILVTIDEAEAPRPVVIDFGIAKALAGRLTEATVFTAQGMMIGTPEYMSPEQADLSEADIDTRSDVYALGVILYELLSGMLPFDSMALRAAGWAAIRRIIREEDPPRPSTRLNGLAATPASSKGAGRKAEPAAAEAGAGRERRLIADALDRLERGGPTLNRERAEWIAQQRRVPLADLTRTLRSELEWIPLKALRKDRAERYRSAAELADDINNYLARRPLIAGPLTATYKARKFVRRHRGSVAAGATAVAALVLATGVSVLFGLREAAAREREAEQKDAALKAADHATAIKDYLIETLASSDPEQRGRQDMLVSEALMRGAQRLHEGALDDQPQTKAEILGASARILNSNGKSEAALPLAEEALSILRGLHKSDHSEVALALGTLASVWSDAGHPVEAEPLSVQALEINRRLFEGDHAEVAKSLSRLAIVRYSLGRAAEAEPLCVQAMEMYQRLFKGDHSDVAASMDNLAAVRASLGRPADAEPLHVQALEMRRRLFHGDHPDVAASLNNLAMLLRSMGRVSEAEPMCVQALEMYQRLFKGDHPDVARSLFNLAGVLTALGRAAEAEPLDAQALEMRQRFYGSDHPRVADSLTNLAGVRLSLGRPAEAEQLYAQALEMRQRLFGGDHIDVARSLSNLSGVLLDLGRAEEAAAKADEAVAMVRRLSPQDQALLARALWRAACARLAAGHASVALPLSEESVAIAETILAPNHPRLAEYQDALAQCRQALGK